MTPNNARIILVQEEPRGPSQLIEVPVEDDGNSRVPFPDIQQLKNTTDQKIIIKALRLIPAGVLVAPVISNFPTAPDTEIAKISLVLYCEGWEKGQSIPLFTLNDNIVPGATTPYRYHATRFNDWNNVDWTKSFLQYSNGTASAGAPYTVLLDCEYVKLNKNGDEIVGPS